jgi:hypothetical protein
VYVFEAVLTVAVDVGLAKRTRAIKKRTDGRKRGGLVGIGAAPRARLCWALARRHDGAAVRYDRRPAPPVGLFRFVVVH